MEKQGYHTNIIKVGNSKGILIPREYLESFGNEVILEKTKEGLLLRPANEILPLKDWAKIFAAADTNLEPEFYDWENTLGDGIT